jgi:hypothetical protein
VPPKRRPGGGFGGSLLAVPTPIPDDDEVDQQEASTPAAVTPAPQSTAAQTPSDVKSGNDERPAERRADPDREVIDDEVSQQPPAHQTPPAPQRIGKRPPSTIRLDDRAGHPLFDAFLVAKQQDPFLSYRQFASGIVLDGLAAHRRRRKRS